MEDGREQPDESLQTTPESEVTFGERVRRVINAAGDKLLPKKVIQEVRKYRSYAGIERSLYLKMKVLNGIGLMNPKRSRPPKGARSFVFVCFGNIMRSPMCEALMNRALAGVPDKRI